MLRAPYWDMWKTEIVSGVCGCAGIGAGIVVGFEAYPGIGSLAVIVVGSTAFDLVVLWWGMWLCVCWSVSSWGLV